MNQQLQSSADEVKNRLIRRAEVLFKKYGVRSVLMDDIAKELAISKRTLYQYFPNKDELVMSVMSDVMNSHQTMVEHLKKSADNSVHLLILLTDYFKSELASINAVLFYDLQKFYPKAWEVYRLHKENVMCCDMAALLKQGIAEGLFWDDMDCEVIAKFRSHQIEMALNHEIFPGDRFDLVQVQIQLFQHFIRGICTPKGMSLYQNYLTNNTTEI